MRIILNKTRNSIRKGNDGAILFALHMLYKQLQHLKNDRIDVDGSEDLWWDAAHVQDYVGVSERTLYRYQHKGMLGIVRKEHGKRLFLASAVERFKRAYWNL